MVKSKPLMINKKGMITIPADIRKKYQLEEGSKVSLLEVNGHLELVPIVNLDLLRNHTAKELLESIEEDNEAEILLEDED